MKLPVHPLLPAAVAAMALMSPTAFAQGKTDYTLNDGQVRFHVPADWSAVMEKTDGNPQAIAFQVPDPSARGSEDSATATVKTRQIRNAGDFSGVVQEDLDLAKAQGGYEIDTSNTNTAIHQYFVVRGKTRYLVRDSSQLSGNIAIEVRCQRPLLEATPAAWNTQFDNACDAVIASLKR